MEWKSESLCEECYIEVVDIAPASDAWKTLQDQLGKPE